jgi:hypothetical protein
MATSVLLVIAIGLFVGLVVIPHLHFIVIAIAHLFHPHVLGIVAAVVAVALLLLAVFSPARVMAPVQPIVMRAEPGHAAMEVRDAPAATNTPHDFSIAESSPAPTWAKLVPVTLILLGIAVAVALLANPHFRALLQSRPAAIILAVCAIVVVMLLFTARVSYHAAIVSSSNTNAPIPASPIVASRPPTRPPSEKKGSTQPKAEPQTHSTPLTAENSETDAASLPEWVHRKPNITEDPYYVVVSSDEYSADAFSRDEMLNARIGDAADRYIREVMRRPTVADAVKFDPLYLRSAYLDTEAGTATAGEQVFVRLKFDSRFQAEVDHRWRQLVSSDRLEKLSGFSAVGLALLGVVYIYLRATSPKQAS